MRFVRQLFVLNCLIFYCARHEIPETDTFGVWNTLQANFFLNKRTCSRSVNYVELTMQKWRSLCKKNSEPFIVNININFTNYTHGFMFCRIKTTRFWNSILYIYPRDATFIVRNTFNIEAIQKQVTVRVCLCFLIK